jgi:hypothetical protein
MKKGKIVSKAVLLIVLVYPILFSGCGLLFNAIADKARAADSAAYEKNKQLTDASENDFDITKTDKGAVIKRYRGKNINIQIPSNIKGMPVIGISDEAFLNKGLINVIIPDGVTSIGRRAFSMNHLSSVTIPNSVTTIGDSAFADNFLKSVTIPNGVNRIGVRAFNNNNLNSVIIPDSVTTIGAFAFTDNPLASASVSSATRVDESAFGGRRITIRPTEAEKEEKEAKELAAKQKREEEERARQIDETTPYVRNLNMGFYEILYRIINGSYEKVTGDKDSKLYYSLPSFLSAWSGNSRYNNFLPPVRDINSIIGDAKDSSFINKSILYCLDDDRIGFRDGRVVFVTFINDTVNNNTVEDLLKKNSLYYYGKLLLGWARKLNNNNTQTPIDSIFTILVLQQTDTVRFIIVQYSSIVYTVKFDDPLLLYYNKEKGGYAVINIEKLTIEQLRNLDPTTLK